MYRVLRWLPHGLLASHLFLKLITQDRSIFLDLILYNVIWIAAVIAIAQSPLSNDPVAVASAGTGRAVSPSDGERIPGLAGAAPAL